MLELINNTLNFSFPDVHKEAKVGLDFQRTLRIPDDDKNYGLPPGLGSFPVKHIDEVPETNIPSIWKGHGGVMIPMFQSEALWINFYPNQVYNRGSAYPFAIRVATGKISAITAKPFGKNLEAGDYLIVPDQPWLDGFVVEKGIIRQFVASPIGSNVSVEYQITGEDSIGGLQIEVFPMKGNIYDEKYPVEKRSMTRGMNMMSFASAAYSEPMGMSLDVGGKMKQQLFEDPYDFDVWDLENSSKVFVHLTNSMLWRAITGQEPPQVSLTAKEYTQRGLPWFDYYAEKPYKEATEEMKGIKSMKDMPGGAVLLPENESVDESKQTIDLSPKNPDEVREGSF